MKLFISFSNRYDDRSSLWTELQSLFVGLVIAPTTLWMALAMHYHFQWLWLRLIVSFVPLATVGMSLSFLPLALGD